MRGRGRMVATVVGALLLLPGSAGANGGAYIEIDRTHVLPGEQATARAYVFVPESKQHLLDRGPFFAYLLPKGTFVREDRPLPEGTIRLGSFSIERDRRESFELELEFTVPEVESGLYSLGMCNDPCTLSGLREPLSGELSIVETPREGELLTTQFKLETRIWRLRRDVRQAERRLEQATAQLAQSQEDNTVLGELVNEARRESRATPSPVPVAVAAEQRPLMDGRATIVAALLLVVAVAIRRRRGRAPIELPPWNDNGSAAPSARAEEREPVGRTR